MKAVLYLLTLRVFRGEWYSNLWGYDLPPMNADGRR